MDIEEGNDEGGKGNGDGDNDKVCDGHQAATTQAMAIAKRVASK